MPPAIADSRALDVSARVSQCRREGRRKRASKRPIEVTGGAAPAHWRSSAALGTSRQEAIRRRRARQLVAEGGAGPGGTRGQGGAEGEVKLTQRRTWLLLVAEGPSRCLDD
ncbi:MAG: hypothetical protein INR71_15245 [Terriglobus roseus]|nr:hypothetical protein [Terriglobus roseus]